LRVARLRRLDGLFGRIAGDSEGGIAKCELGFETDESWRESATSFCGGIRPRGHFRFLDFGHPSLLFLREAPAQMRPAQVESEAGGRFVQIGKTQFC
jgi:hypothetical protein